MKLAKEIRWAFGLLCCACCCALAGCEDTRDDYLGEYQTRFYFRNSGEQAITLFKVGENTVYDIPICKAGRSQSGTGTVTVSVMDQEQLDIYNLSNLTSYRQLPSDYYAFLTETEFFFESDDSYKIARVEMQTDRISELQESDPSSDYVLALQVRSDVDGTVSPDVNVLIIAPSIDIVHVSLATSGLVSQTYTSASPTRNAFSNSLSVNIDNRWDFTCGLAAYDQAWLDAYNELNDTSYELLPEEWYEFPSRVDFVSGRSSSAFDVTIDRSGMELLKDYVLPIYVTDCTKEQFVVDEEQSLCLLNVRLDPDQIALDESMLSSPYTHSGDDGQGLAGLCDGDVNTYWQSEWSKSVTGDETYGLYIDIALKEPLSAIVVKYCTRNSTYVVNIPQGIVIGVSSDGENWEVLGSVFSGLPNTEATWYTMPAFSSETTFNYVRFGVAVTAAGDRRGESGSSVSTNLGEIELYGANLIDGN